MKKRCKNNKLHRRCPSNDSISSKLYKQKLRITAPEDFRFIDNTNEVIDFFNDIKHQVIGSIFIDLSNVNKVDYAAVSILRATEQYMQEKHTFFSGNFPENEKCKTFLIESGFLENHYINGRKFSRQTDSTLMFFQKGYKQIDAQAIGETVKNANYFLTGNRESITSVTPIILEMCGNASEWANSLNNLWLLGMHRAQDYIRFTVTDLGKGILGTLHKKFKDKFFEFIGTDDNISILKGAFDKKYGSASREENRNKGLPSIKKSVEENNIKDLFVVTNNVKLHFCGGKNIKTDKLGHYFNGTFYQFDITKETIR